MSRPVSSSQAATTLPGGVFAASLTPLTADFRVDTELLVEHVRWLLAHGCDGVALFGTTGEANSLSVAERLQGLEALLEAGVAPRRLLVGSGCCSVADTVALTRHATRHQVGGVLMLPPFYYKNPGVEGLFAFYDQVIQQVGEANLAIYLYHIPPVSQIPLPHMLVERLLQRYPQTIAGMKDSGGDFAHTTSIQQSFPQLHLFAGTERYLLDTLRLGGAGCISASANVSCVQAARVLDAWRQESTGVEELQDQLTAIRSALEPFPMIAALKFLNAERTSVARWRMLCPPLVPLDDNTGQQVLSAVHDKLQ